MLISIAIKNFKSFDQCSIFSMIASKKLRSDKEKINDINDVSLLKSAVIYGANASGKSNLIEAFRFVKECVVSANGIPLKSSQFYCKNDHDNENRITTFEIRMCIDKRCYAYGFDVLLKDRTIKSEWVLEFNKANKPTVLFKREQGVFQLNDTLNLDDTEKMKFKVYADDLSEHNSILFLSEINRNKKLLKHSDLSFFNDIYRWFSEDVKIFSADAAITSFEYYYDEKSLETVKHMIQSFDTGISDIKIKEITLEELRSKLSREVFQDVINKVKERTETVSNNLDEFHLSMRSRNEFFNIQMNAEDVEPKVTTLMFKHGDSLCDFDFKEESDGTKRLFDLIDILLTRHSNSVYIIDELEKSLHPAMTKHFIKLLNEQHKRNNNQLIFTTHEATIMSQNLFRRDQIWFTARDNKNNTRLYPLDRFNERYDKKIDKAYLEGRYGAVPVFGDSLVI